LLQRNELELPRCPVHGPTELSRGRCGPVVGGWLVPYSWWCGGNTGQRRRARGLCVCPRWCDKLGSYCRDCGREI
jgi:hypothetical protein